MRFPFVRRIEHEAQVRSLTLAIQRADADRDRMQLALTEALHVARQALDQIDRPVATVERELEPLSTATADRLYVHEERQRRLRPGEDPE